MIGLVAVPAWAVDLAGTWELQTMGADRTVTLEQKGDTVLAHRVMWPEFEGQKYKLEHLYRGKLVGNAIKGDLLVKEEELPKFEVLRTFTGSVSNGQQMTLDGLPMKRVGNPAQEPTPALPSAPLDSKRPSEPPGVAAATPPPPPPPPSVPPKGSASEVDPGNNLFASIMAAPGMGGMFEVALRMDIPDEAKALSDEADRRFGSGDYQGALEKYNAAQAAAGGQHVEFLHRVGRCHLRLKAYPEALDTLRRALKLDPSNAEIKKDYKLAKQKAGKKTKRGV